MVKSIKYWSVAVDCPLHAHFTYSDEGLTFEQKSLLRRGVKVRVPFGKRKSTTGVLLQELESYTDEYKLKSILEIDVLYPSLPESYMLWIEWLAQYYYYPIGPIFNFVYPPLEKADGNKRRKSRKDSPVPTEELKPEPQLTSEQFRVVEDIATHPHFGVHLIFGVTGSGKTEVYMQALNQYLIQGKSGLVIVPEIALTPQLIRRFVERFGDRVAVIHSHLTSREKTNQWWDMVEGRKSILIGARSALFCPLPHLGIIIVDEEHEPSFKQEETLRYHARDAAIVLAKYNNCPILLGSATPALESWNNAVQGRYHLHRLNFRVENRALPDVEIIDLKVEKAKRKGLKEKPPYPSWMTERLWEEMLRVLSKGQQVALFLNRRGFANVVQCPECGFTVECPNCDISLTLHGTNHLVCHYCDYHYQLMPTCHHCHEGEWIALGLGTEQMEQDLKKAFPDHVIARADRDEITNREDMEFLIKDMESGKIQILIGTQMIAKGLDFPNLTLVGLVLADVGLHMPDFRSGERGFQIITQVSGRAGRHVKAGEAPGKVVIQTYSPEHESIIKACKADYEAFAHNELQTRQELHYPPFGRLLSFRISGMNKSEVQALARQLKFRALELQQKYPIYSEIQVMGPTEAPLARLRNQYRYQLLAKGLKTQVLNAFVRQLMGDSKWIPPKLQITIDVDPMNML